MARLSRAKIEAEDRNLPRRYRAFRIAADCVTAAWRSHPGVVAVSPIGSVARDPWKENPRCPPADRLAPGQRLPPNPALRSARTTTPPMLSWAGPKNPPVTVPASPPVRAKPLPRTSIA